VDTMCVSSEHLLSGGEMDERERRNVILERRLWETLGELSDDPDVLDRPKPKQRRKSQGKVATTAEQEAKPRGHSRLIREISWAAVTKWKASPYISTSSKHQIFISKNGNVFVRELQELRLNSDRQRIPCSVELKPEKRAEYLASKPALMDEACWFRSRWLINRFSVWHRETRVGVPPADWVQLDSSTDERGTESKHADLRVELQTSSRIRRETLVGIQDYVQWKRDDRDLALDRLDIAIDIPTKKLEIEVFVDAELYSQTFGQDELRGDLLGIEFRNREGARFRTELLHDDPTRSLKVTKKMGRAGGDLPGETLQNLFEQIRRECDATPNGAELREDATLPAKCLALKVEWPSPYMGILLCVAWPKPRRSSGEKWTEDVASASFGDDRERKDGGAAERGERNSNKEASKSEQKRRPVKPAVNKSKPRAKKNLSRMAPRTAKKPPSKRT
jgi:hypothetical protein